MSNDDNGHESDKAPTNGRWVKGKSGNPKGRPKKEKKAVPKPTATDKAIRDEALRAADSMMKFLENGQEVEMSVRNSVGRSQTVTALKGHPLAQKHWQERDDRLRHERAAEIAEDHELWTEYVANYEKNVANYEKEGKVFPVEYPHPQELVFRDDQLVMNNFGGKPFEVGKTREFLRKARDALILQTEKDRRHYRSEGMGEPLCAAEFLAILFNGILAEPFQLSDIQLIIQMDHNRTLKNAELQNRLAAAWDGLELPKGLNDRTSLLMTPLLYQWGAATHNAKPLPRYRRLL